MSLLLSDLLIWILLLAGLGFAGLSIFGLFIFPDIRSRMYTALRACMISVAALSGAAAVYGLSLSSVSGGAQYLTLLALVILLFAIVAAGMITVQRMLLDGTKDLVFHGPETEPAADTEMSG